MHTSLRTATTQSVVVGSFECQSWGLTNLDIRISLVNIIPLVDDSSSDESESEDSYQEQTPTSTPIQATPTALGSAVKWLVVSLHVPSYVHNSEVLAAFMRLLAENSSSVLIAGIATTMPASIYTLRRSIRSDRDNFRQYVLCPRFSIYLKNGRFEVKSMGTKMSKRCQYTKFHNHPQRNRRIPCNAPLYVKVKHSDGKTVFRPK